MFPALGSAACELPSFPLPPPTIAVAGILAFAVGSGRAGPLLACGAGFGSFGGGAFVSIGGCGRVGAGDGAIGSA